MAGVSPLALNEHCDEDINTIVTPTGPAAIHTGPITRARARQLNYQVLSFLGNDSNVHENMMLPKLDDRGGVSRSFDEMITIDLVETTLTIRLQTCNDVVP